jgi:hypothetical protein
MGEGSRNSGIEHESVPHLRSYLSVNKIGAFKIVTQSGLTPGESSSCPVKDSPYYLRVDQPEQRETVIGDLRDTFSISCRADPKDPLIIRIESAFDLINAIGPTAVHVNPFTSREPIQRVRPPYELIRH